MQLNELKKSMSALDEMLAKTNPEVMINVAASQTAQIKLLKKIRQGFLSCIIVAVVFTAMALGNIEPQSFPNYLKIYMAICLAVGGGWYLLVYYRLKRVDVAGLTPASLIAKTAKIKLMMISGELCLLVCLAIFFTLLFQSFWSYNQVGFWAMVVCLLFAVVYGIGNVWAHYIKLFRELNSIKE